MCKSASGAARWIALESRIQSAHLMPLASGHPSHRQTFERTPSPEFKAYTTPSRHHQPESCVSAIAGSACLVMRATLRCEY